MGSEPNGRLAYSCQEAADALGLSLCLVRELVRQGKIPSIRLSERRILIPRRSLEILINGETTRADGDPGGDPGGSGGK